MILLLLLLLLLFLLYFLVIPVRIYRCTRIFCLIAESWRAFSFRRFLCRFTIYIYRYFQDMFTGSFVSSFHRSAICKISTGSEPNVLIIHNTIIGGVEPKPSIIGNEYFHPGMRCSY